MTDNKDGSTGSNRRFGRRSVLLGTGGTIVGASSIVGASNAFAGEDSNGADDGSKQKGGTKDSDTEASEFQGVYHNEAVLWDSDMDMAFTNRMRLASDPAGGDREGVVHITSGEDTSKDYAVSGIDLRSRDLTLGEMKESGFSYDYFKGTDATYRVPDEVFLILQSTDGGITVTYRKEDTEQPEQWHTRNVEEEFSKDRWREIAVDSEEIDLEDEQVRVTSEVIGNNIMAIREQDTYADVLSRYGDDTSVLAVAIGNGSVDGERSDAYFHNIQVAETAYTVPATLTMEPSFDSQRERGSGRVTVSLSFASEEHGVSVADIDPESVRMTSYSPFAPPIPGTDVPGGVVVADDASVSDSEETLTAEFAPAGQVNRFARGNRSSTVLVFGGFEEEPYRFVAVGELEGV